MIDLAGGESREVVRGELVVVGADNGIAISTPALLEQYGYEAVTD